MTADAWSPPLDVSMRKIAHSFHTDSAQTGGDKTREAGDLAQPKQADFAVQLGLVPCSWPSLRQVGAAQRAPSPPWLGADILDAMAALHGKPEQGNEEMPAAGI